jgi:hypothetical protein
MKAESTQVRNGVNPTRMYLEAEKFDDVLRTIIVETDIPPPTQPVAANAAYSLWSIVSSDAFGQYTIGAEIDGVKISLNNVLGLFSLSVCPES